MSDVFALIRADLENGKLSHAILIDGGREESRLDVARQTAQALVCTGEHKPCGTCPDCVKALAQSHPDIIVYSGTSTPGSFKVDTVREVRQSANVLPNEAAQKVFILHNAQGMAAAAQNALLKILEEPPRYVRFILTCAGHEQMLQTILSRVSVYTLPADGLQGDPEKLAAAQEIAEKILLAVAAQKEVDVLKQTSAFEGDKTLFSLCCACMHTLCAQALIGRYTRKDASGAAAELSSLMPAAQLLQIQNICMDTMDDLQNNINNNLLMTYFSARLCAGQNERN